jgi:hypothetical protein
VDLVLKDAKNAIQNFRKIEITHAYAYYLETYSCKFYSKKYALMWPIQRRQIENFHFFEH